MPYTKDMNKTPQRDANAPLTFSDFTRYDHLDIISATLAAERDERRAARAARDAGAVFTHWFITER